MDASTQKLLLLCERVDLACARIPGVAAVERAAGMMHTLSLPHVSPCEHKVMAACGHDDVAEMVRAMQAARCCEIVAVNQRVQNWCIPYFNL